MAKAMVSPAYGAADAKETGACSPAFPSTAASASGESGRTALVVCSATRHVAGLASTQEVSCEDVGSIDNPHKVVLLKELVAIHEDMAGLGRQWQEVLL